MVFDNPYPSVVAGSSSPTLTVFNVGGPDNPYPTIDSIALVGGPSRYFRLWMRSTKRTGSGLPWLEVTQYNNLKFARVQNGIGNLSVSVIVTDPLMATYIGEGAVLHLTDKKSTNGYTRFDIYDFDMRDSSVGDVFPPSTFRDDSNTIMMVKVNNVRTYDKTNVKNTGHATIYDLTGMDAMGELAQSFPKFVARNVGSDSWPAGAYGGLGTGGVDPSGPDVKTIAKSIIQITGFMFAETGSGSYADSVTGVGYASNSGPHSPDSLAVFFAQKNLLQILQELASIGPALGDPPSSGTQDNQPLPLFINARFDFTAFHPVTFLFEANKVFAASSLTVNVDLDQDGSVRYSIRDSDTKRYWATVDPQFYGGFNARAIADGGSFDETSITGIAALSGSPFPTQRLLDRAPYITREDAAKNHAYLLQSMYGGAGGVGRNAGDGLVSYELWLKAPFRVQYNSLSAGLFVNPGRIVNLRRGGTTVFNGRITSFSYTQEKEEMFMSVGPPNLSASTNMLSSITSTLYANLG